MTKKTFKNSNFKGYKIMVKYKDLKYYFYCKYETQNEWHLCYVEKDNDTWNCIINPTIYKDTFRMFDYTVSVYNAEVFGEEYE